PARPLRDRRAHQPGAPPPPPHRQREGPAVAAWLAAATRIQPGMAARLALAAMTALLLAAAPSASASPRVIAFVHDRDIWVVGLDVLGAHNLTNTPYPNELSPPWPP